MAYEENTVLDRKMSEVYDWSDSDTPVRDALWDHFMENNNHDTIKTSDEMDKYEDMSDDDVKKNAEKLLKK
ncbi:P8 family protein [Nicoliella lavandulae]|uniref:Uncharacterized protein n=1 Tax=Nicoliella lavandulae TaxID=3082954 RepID=A0ABU8SJN3_9LACO